MSYMSALPGAFVFWFPLILYSLHLFYVTLSWVAMVSDILIHYTERYLLCSPDSENTCNDFHEMLKLAHGLGELPPAGHIDLSVAGAYHLHDQHRHMSLIATVFAFGLWSRLFLSWRMCLLVFTLIYLYVTKVGDTGNASTPLAHFQLVIVVTTLDFWTFLHINTQNVHSASRLYGAV